MIKKTFLQTHEAMLQPGGLSLARQSEQYTPKVGLLWATRCHSDSVEQIAGSEKGFESNAAVNANQLSEQSEREPEVRLWAWAQLIQASEQGNLHRGYYSAAKCKL